MVTPKSGPQRSLGVYGCYPIHRLPGKKITLSRWTSRSFSTLQLQRPKCCMDGGDSHASFASISIFSLLIIQGKDFSSPPVDQVALLEAGDASVYDGRILHCGTGNASERPRLLLVVTVRHPEGNVAPESRKTQRALRGAATLGELSELREKIGPA